jgi:hypothetical protein
VNASSFGVRRYFMDENALAFNVDISGAPGTQWPEPRVGPVRPRLELEDREDRKLVIGKIFKSNYQLPITNMANKKPLRNILGDLPFTAEIDWMLRSKNRPRKDHFNLDRVCKNHCLRLLKL